MANINSCFTNFLHTNFNYPMAYGKGCSKKLQTHSIFSPEKLHRKNSLDIFRLSFDKIC